MKKLLLMMIVISFFSATTSIAKDYKNVHSLKPGDVISADIFNELFNELENVTRVTVSDDLVGTWSLVQTTCAGGGPGNCTGGVTLNGSSLNTDGLTRSRIDVVSLSNDGDNTYSWSQNTYSSFVRTGGGNIAGSGNFTVVDGMGVFEDAANNPGDLAKFQIRRISSTRYIMSWSTTTGSSFNIIRLDKQAIPPTTPGKLTAIVTGMEVSLYWDDLSNDETEFLVLRRDLLEGQFTQVGATASANTVIHVDTVPSAGTYWYRIRSANTNGQSLGTNVIKVVVQ